MITSRDVYPDARKGVLLKAVNLAYDGLEQLKFLEDRTRNGSCTEKSNGSLAIYVFVIASKFCKYMSETSLKSKCNLHKSKKDFVKCQSKQVL